MPAGGGLPCLKQNIFEEGDSWDSTAQYCSSTALRSRHLPYPTLLCSTTVLSTDLNGVGSQLQAAMKQLSIAGLGWDHDPGCSVGYKVTTKAAKQIAQGSGGHVQRACHSREMILEFDSGVEFLCLYKSEKRPASFW